MRIGIFTQYYKSSNYGGLLQAYALSTFLRKKGFDAEQVCFDFYVKKSKKTRSICSVIKEKGFLNTFWTIFNRFIFDKIGCFLFGANKKIITRLNSCKEFRESVICHSEKVYDGVTVENCKEYDVFITGSDQVWSCNEVAFNPVFWLSFVKEGVKKISYAASISVNEIPEELRDFIRTALSSFRAISVREKEDLKLLMDIVDNQKITCTIDPTFLLDKEDWDCLLEKNPFPSKQYIFTYFLGGKRDDRLFAKRFAKKKNMMIVSIPYMQNQYRSSDTFFGDVQLSNVSPQLFLTLIKNAAYVITDSFHGTVFSSIFHVNFFVLKRNSDKSKKSMNSRLYSLLDMLKLQERMISNDIDLSNLEALPAIDFCDKDLIICEEKRKSISFLMDAITH